MVFIWSILATAPEVNKYKKRRCLKDQTRLTGDEPLICGRIAASAALSPIERRLPVKMEAETP